MASDLVVLDRDELAEAWGLAQRRMDGVQEMGLQEKHGAQNHRNSEYHILGARGEIAFRKFIGSSGALTVNTFRSVPDVDGYEVRTRSRDDYDLILRSDDPDDKIYVLVVGRGCRFRVVGWLRGSERYRHGQKAYGGRPPAWFVPQCDLHEMSELP
jgi:hypothetical protein